MRIVGHFLENDMHIEKNNAEITQIWAIFTFGHGYAMHHSLKIVKITLYVILNLY